MFPPKGPEKDPARRRDIVGGPGLSDLDRCLKRLEDLRYGFGDEIEASFRHLD